MQDHTSFLMAFIVGVLGTTHCLGMCGGIAGMLSIGTQKLFATGKLLRTLSYNLGRISSYTLAGIIVGFAGQNITDLLPPELAHTTARLVSASFAILMALYLFGWGRILIGFEKLGGKLWRHIEPMGRKYIPANNSQQALLLGLIWGWLPCGLVYSMLAWSLASANPWSGAWLMLGFGLGTLPTLLAIGMAGSWIVQWRKQPMVRYIAGSVLITLAVFSLLQEHDVGHGLEHNQQHNQGHGAASHQTALHADSH